MKMYFRPFLKMVVVAAPAAITGMRYFSVMLATASVRGDEYGENTASGVYGSGRNLVSGLSPLRRNFSLMRPFSR